MKYMVTSLFLPDIFHIVVCLEMKQFEYLLGLLGQLGTVKKPQKSLEKLLRPDDKEFIFCVENIGRSHLIIFWGGGN